MPAFDEWCEPYVEDVTAPAWSAKGVTVVVAESVMTEYMVVVGSAPCLSIVWRGSQLSELGGGGAG